MLRIVLQCTNESEFDEKLDNLVSRLGSEETETFQSYFIQNYVNSKRRWGYCYRIGDAINTNMFVESFHRTFKYKYLRGKYNKRVDVCLINLLKYSRDKVIQTIIQIQYKQ
jgi:hypothetical protein